jgi:hypothetical protein
MKLHPFHSWDAPRVQPRNPGPSSHEDLKYGALLVLGVPAIVVGSMYLVEAVFNFLVH